MVERVQEKGFPDWGSVMLQAYEDNNFRKINYTKNLVLEGM